MNIDEAIDGGTEGAVSPSDVVDVALELFAKKGYSDAKLEAIATKSGMSKRMIHYHFGNKRGLYLRSLTEAVHRAYPDPKELELDSSVPVEGVRKMVDAIWTHMVSHPKELTLLVGESLHNNAKLKNSAPLADASELTLHLDKLLMLGQDAGAFRPGISAEDVFTLITSFAYYRVSLDSVMKNLLDIDMDRPENLSGMHRLVMDTVLAFLTSNIPATGQSSYLTPEVSDEPQSAAEIYFSDGEFD
ncbi:TetR family transcriptional regulator [Corynebacterium sp. 3HC-13]|uniref:TetR/AcrR family transcriptional regulator n=1 Tax=Corynebacterium poyangense TaxID=2684405 RepID=UPI001CCC1592|nr:TetR/AcrR family transcriptional regulator [Corynebacterium poyangense]MBZ8178317.1 TetR family transcriptional regulator [Corynebacterium poyangense]